MAEEFKISDWLQSAKEDPKKFVPPVIVVIAVAFVVWKFMYSPKALLIEKELKKHKGIAKERKSFENAANKLEDIKIDIEEKKKKWNEAQALCYKVSERTTFIKKVRELATQAGMKIRNIAPLQDVPMKLGVVDAKKFSVQFAYSGDLTKLLTFMRLIELDNKTTFMPIPNLKINASGTFDLSLIVTTVLLPDVISTEIPAGQEEEEEEEED